MIRLVMTETPIGTVAYNIDRKRASDEEVQTFLLNVLDLVKNKESRDILVNDRQAEIAKLQAKLDVLMNEN